MFYVDDMLIASKNMEQINRLKAYMDRVFHMKDLGDVKKIFGIEIHKDKKNGKLKFHSCNMQRKCMRTPG